MYNNSFDYNRSDFKELSIPYFLNNINFLTDDNITFINNRYFMFNRFFNFDKFYFPFFQFIESNFGERTNNFESGNFYYGFFHSFFDIKTFPKEINVSKDYNNLYYFPDTLNNVVYAPFTSFDFNNDDTVYYYWFFCGIPVRTKEFGLKLFKKFMPTLNSYNDCKLFYDKYFNSSILDNNIFFEDLLKIN